MHNGSTKEHVEKLKSLFPQMDHLVLPVNRGFAGGANAGLEYGFTKNDWCLFLTNDTTLVKVGEIPKTKSFVGLKIIKRNTEQIDSIGGIFEPEIGKLEHKKSAIAFIQSEKRKYIPGTAFLLHKNIFQMARGFNESLFMYWEDVDFSQRVQALGFNLQITEDWVLRHSIGKTCHGKSLYSLFYYQKNRKLVSKTYCPKNKLWLLYVSLGKDWLRLFFKLLIKKRFQDIKLLYSAIRS